MGSSDEQFCLKWNDYQHCIKSTFQSLRDDSDFMDVTLSCDGEQLKAHKVILSSCSVTFKNLLKQTPTSHPVFVLWDIEPRDLSAILDFMYNGEVNVEQSHLTSFLSVAERLRVRGLCQDEVLNADDRHSSLHNSSKTSKDTSSSHIKQQHHHQPPTAKSSKSSSRNSDQLILAGSPMTANASADANGGSSAAPPSKRAKLISSSAASSPAASTGDLLAAVAAAAAAGVHQNSRSVIMRAQDANNEDDIEEIPMDIKHELDQQNSTLTSANSNSITTRRAPSFDGSAAAVVAAAAAAAVASGNPTGLTVKDLAALSYSASAAAANSGANSGGSGAADEDYGDYYEDEAGFGGGVDPVDQSQVGKEWFPEHRNLLSPPRGGLMTNPPGSSEPPCIDLSQRHRTVYSRRQVIELEKEFSVNPFIHKNRRTEMSQELQLSERQIKIWFQNRENEAEERRRRKQKKIKSIIKT